MRKITPFPVFFPPIPATLSQGIWSFAHLLLLTVHSKARPEGHYQAFHNVKVVQYDD